MTSLNQLRKDVDTLKRALLPSLEKEKGEEIHQLLRVAEKLATWNSPIWKDAAKQVAKDYAEGRI